MLVRTLGLSASLALAAHAVLIPSTTALKEVADDQVVPLQAFGEKTLVQFACPGCPYARFDEAKNMVWSTTEVENSIIYEFSTGRYHDRLALNGVQLFPPAFDEPEPIFVQQVPSAITPDDMAEFLKSNPDRRPLRITQMVFAFNSAQTVSENGNELLVMHLTVSGLEGQSVSPQLIRISVLKDISGRLFIAEVKGKTDPAEVQAEEEKQCKNWPMLCKWRDIIEDKLSALKNSMNKSGKPKGCNKGRPGAGRVDNRPHHVKPGHIRPGHHGRPPVHDPPFGRPHGGPPGHPPHRHHHHSKMHRIAHMVSHLIMTVIVPIFVGVAAGVATYMAGLLIGMAVAFIWIKIRGTSHGQYDRVALDEEDADDDDDVPPYTPTNKEYFVVEQSAEAGLESPPVYEEVAQKESAN